MLKQAIINFCDLKNTIYLKALIEDKGERIIQSTLSTNISKLNTDVIVIDEMKSTINGGQKSNIDISIYKDNKVEELIELKVAYLGEFFEKNKEYFSLKDSKDGRFINLFLNNSVKEKNKEVPSGIMGGRHKDDKYSPAYLKTGTGIINDMQKRENVTGIYVLKEIHVPKTAPEFSSMKQMDDYFKPIPYGQQLMISEIGKEFLEKIKMYIQNIGDKVIGEDRIFVDNPISIDLGEWEGFKVRLHFFVIENLRSAK